MSRRADQSSLPIRGEGKRGADVLDRQFREVLEDIPLGHARGEVFEDVVNGDPQSTDVGFPPRFWGSIVMRPL